MSGLDHLKKVETHFISGEPGTTGREPFEDSTSGRTAQNFNSGAHGATSGSALGGAGLGQGHEGHNHGLTGDHQHGQHGLVDHARSQETDGRNHSGGNPLTTAYGRPSDSHLPNNQHGMTSGEAHHNHASGLTGEHDKSHFSNDKPTRHTNENERDGKVGIVDKAKAAVGLGGAGHQSSGPDYAAADRHNRGPVDKLNDGLPGTPAHAGSSGAYGPGHTHADRDQHTGTTHGAHASDHYGPGRTGADNHQTGIGGAGLAGGLGGAGLAGAGHHTQGDRVGALGQGSDQYEGGMHSGPRTGGAAGTDRFDSERRHGDEGVHHDTSQRAPGQSSGGIGGILGTSDKDFTGRERQGKGAYADTDGQFDLNKSGPAGNSALTGREGNLDNNPVREAGAHNAHAPATVPATAGTTTGAHGPHDAHGAAHDGEKKGLFQKVKEAIL